MNRKGQPTKIGNPNAWGFVETGLFSGEIPKKELGGKITKFEKPNAWGLVKSAKFIGAFDRNFTGRDSPLGLSF